MAMSGGAVTVSAWDAGAVPALAGGEVTLNCWLVRRMIMPDCLSKRQPGGRLVRGSGILGSLCDSFAHIRCEP